MYQVIYLHIHITLPKFVLCFIGDNGKVTYSELKKDLQQFIQATVESTVQQCFQDHFARLAALMEIHAKPTNIITESAEDPVENHKRVSNEVELHEWNIKLRNQELVNAYVS